MSIRLFYDEVSFRYKNWKNTKKLIERVIRSESKIPGDLSIIITSDEYMKKINVQFLEHDYFTDVITFDYCSGDVVNGEVYIGLGTVKENAVNYKISLEEELFRVIIHGVLHLVGYDDKNDVESDEMIKMEDFWMNSLEE